MQKILTLMIVLLVSCSQVNRDSRDEFQKGQKMRHGIVPVEPFEMKNDQIKKVVTKVYKKEYANDLRGKLNKDSVDRGRALYVKHCLSCHGVEGLGDGPEGAKLVPKPANLQKTAREVYHFKFYLSISEWQGDMPGWKTPFSDLDRDDLTIYLQSLR